MAPFDEDPWRWWICHDSRRNLRLAAVCATRWEEPRSRNSRRVLGPPVPGSTCHSAGFITNMRSPELSSRGLCTGKRIPRDSLWGGSLLPPLPLFVFVCSFFRLASYFQGTQWVWGFLFALTSSSSVLPRTNSILLSHFFSSFLKLGLGCIEDGGL